MRRRVMHFVGSDFAPAPLPIRQQPVVQRDPLDDEWDDRPVWDASGYYLLGLVVGLGGLGGLWLLAKAVLS